MATSLEIKKGNTTYRLDKGQGSWVIFDRVIQVNKLESSIKECLSVNLDTHEVYCNRTGAETKGFKRYLNLVIRIETLFNLSSLRDL